MTEADRKVARTLMDEGRVRRGKTDLRGALESFRAADALMHFPTTGLEVARAEADLGMLVEARDTVRHVLAIPELASDPAQFKTARANARVLAEDIESRCPTLRIVVEGAPVGTAPEVMLDGTKETPEQAGAPHKVNPGRHVVVATLDGRVAKEEVELLEKEFKNVALILPASEPPQAPIPFVARVTPPNITSPAPAPSTDAPMKPQPRDQTLTYVGFGSAAVGIVVGSVTGILSISSTKAAEPGCNAGRCPPPTHDDLSRAHTFATLSNVAFVVAAVGIAVGIVGLMQRPPRSPAPTRAVLGRWVGVGSGSGDGFGAGEAPR